MVSLIFPASGAALAVNVALLFPASTVTEAGTATLELLPVSVTRTPAPDAVLLRVTEHVLELPCCIDAGMQPMDARFGEVTTLRGNVVTAPFSVAVNIAVRSIVGLPALAEKFTPLDPAGTSTLAGTDTDELSLVSVTVTPPAGAAAVRLTVHWAEDAVAMTPGLQLRLASDTLEERSVRVAVCVTPEELADNTGV